MPLDSKVLAGGKKLADNEEPSHVLPQPAANVLVRTKSAQGFRQSVSDQEVIHSGFLKKKSSGFVRGMRWQKRYCVDRGGTFECDDDFLQVFCTGRPLPEIP